MLYDQASRVGCEELAGHRMGIRVIKGTEHKHPRWNAQRMECKTNILCHVLASVCLVLSHFQLPLLCSVLVKHHYCMKPI
jgi:hypothetical protein